MAYTVKKVAKLSGVSERTLRWYDVIGLLKPAYYGTNGYRYYEEEQLLLLQQILFFRELDIPLEEIRRIITGDDFDKVMALNMHKKTLQRSVERAKALINTIDKTILHIKGEQTMEEREFFNNFSLVTKGKGSESYFGAEEIVLKSIKKPTIEKMEKSYYENINKKAHAIFKEIVHSIENGLDPTSDEVQHLINKHHAFTEKIHNATKEVYKALALLYREHSEFRMQLDPFHPQLAEFLAQAMEVFADRKLS